MTHLDSTALILVSPSLECSTGRVLNPQNWHVALGWHPCLQHIRPNALGHLGSADRGHKALTSDPKGQVWPGRKGHAVLL